MKKFALLGCLFLLILLTGTGKVEASDLIDFADSIGLTTVGATANVLGIGVTLTSLSADSAEVTVDGLTATATLLAGDRFRLTISRLNLVYEGAIADVDAFLAFLRENLNKLLGFGAGSESTLAGKTGLPSSQKTGERVFEQVIAPMAETQEEKKEKEERKRKGEAIVKLPSSLGALFKYESFKVSGKESSLDRDGRTVGGTLGYERVEDRLTLGVLVPIDQVRVNNPVLNLVRLGAVPYASYAFLEDPVELKGTVNLGLTTSSFDLKDLKGFETYSFGAGVSATKDFDFVVATLGTSVQWAGDTSQAEDRSSTTVKFGGNVGVRILQNFVVNLFTNYTRDVSQNAADKDFVLLGFEGTSRFGEIFSLTAGWKTIQGLDDFRSNEFYLGAIYKF